MFNHHAYLYVEDDPNSRQIMQMIMKTVMDIQSLTIFENSHDFAERLCQLEPRPQVFLLDIHVPPISGFQMLDYLRHQPDYEEAIVIALTASVMHDEIEELQHSGFNGAISKPISVQTFPDLLGRILAGEAIWHISE